MRLTWKKTLHCTCEFVGKNTEETAQHIEKEDSKNHRVNWISTCREITLTQYRKNEKWMKGL